MWPGDRACRTRGDTALARSTTIRDRFVRRQFQCGQNFCEKEPRPKPLRDEHGAFAMPSNAAMRSMIAFQHRPGIDITFLVSPKTAKKLVDFMELIGNYVVIILAPRVPRDSPSFRCSRGPVARISLEII